MSADLTAPHFTDSDKAREHLEALHWPNGPICPKCGECENVTRLKGKSTRPGVVLCNSCRKPFTVTVKFLRHELHWMRPGRVLLPCKRWTFSHSPQ